MARYGMGDIDRRRGHRSTTWQRGMRKIEATGLDGTTHCTVCGEPLKLRKLERGEIVEHGELVWFELWSVGTHRHLACCDEHGAPLPEKIRKAEPEAAQ